MLEERLLLDCARIDVDSAGEDRIRGSVQEGPDWARFLSLAERHRVTPLVCKTLERTCPDLFRLPEIGLLGMRTRFIAGRTLQLTREMLSLVALFEKNGISVVPLKGSVLAMAAFGNLSAREFADLDLLVRRRDLPRACELLRSAGYRAELQLPPKQEAAYVRSEHAFTYFRDEQEMTVELHWRLQDRYLSFPLTEAKLWSSVEVQKLFGSELKCLKPEHNFIFLCMHGAKHSWDRLEWISCLRALACAQPAGRWPLIVSEARRLRSTRLLHLGLRLAERLGSAPELRVPLALLPPDSMVDDLAGTVWERLFADEVTGSSREVYRFRFYLKARERMWDRVRVVWSASVRIPHPKSSSWERTSLPASLMFLHYVLSPLGFLTKFGLRGLRGILIPERQVSATVNWWQKEASDKKTVGCNVPN